MSLENIDLLDADRFVRMEHHEMLKTLREQAPLYWHVDPEGGGFWNVVRHADVQIVNRDNELYSSEIGGISIPNPGERVEDGGFVGAASRLAPGVRVKAGALVKATVDVYPDTVVEKT